MLGSTIALALLLAPGTGLKDPFSAAPGASTLDPDLLDPFGAAAPPPPSTDGDLLDPFRGPSRPRASDLIDPFAPARATSLELKNPFAPPATRR